MRLKLIFLLLSVSFFSNAETDQKTIDSLENVANSKNSKLELKIEALNKLSLFYGEFDFKKADNYLKRLYKISKINKSQIGLGHYYMNITDRCMIKGDYILAEKNAKKARSFYLRNKSFENINNIIISNYALCYSLDFQNKIKESEKNALKCIKSYKDKPKNENIAEMYFYISSIYTDEKDINKSFFYINKAIEIFKINKNENGLFKCKYQMANICQSHDMLKQSLTYLDELTANHNNILLLKVEYKLNIEEFYTIILIKQKKYRSALKHAKTYAKLVSQYSFKNYENNSLIILSEIYLGIKKYSLVSQCFSKIDTTKLSEKELYTLNKIKGTYYYNLNDFQKSFYYRNLNYKTDINDAETLKSLAETSFALKDFKSAYIFYKEYAKNEIDQLNQDKNSKLKAYEIKYKIKDKDYVIKNKEFELFKKENELQIQNKYITNFILITSLLFVTILFLTYNYFSKKKSSILLQNKNDELFDTNQLLNKIIKEKELLLKEIHHRVKNNLQLVLSLLNIQAEDTNNNSIDVFLEKSRSRISTMSIIHQNLYLSDNLSCIHFQNYLEELIDYIVQTFENNNIDIKIDSSEIDFDLDLSITLGLIVNELVCNSMKYAFNNIDKGEISINLKRIKEGLYELNISDNGIGFNKNKLKNTNSIGTEIVELLVLQLKGTIEHINQNGTHYKITFESNSL